MKCKKCGKEINQGDNFCPYCGEKVKIEKQYIKGINNDIVLCLLYLFCVIGGPIIYYKATHSNLPTSISIILSQISIIMCLVSVPLLFYTITRHPKSIFAKTLLTINGIIGAVFAIIGIVVVFMLLKLIVDCYNTDWSGFGTIISLMKVLIYGG